jgi:hypothetical protein
MKFSERNEILSTIVNRFKNIHDKYTCSALLLTDDQWETYLHEMDSVAIEYKDSNMSDFTGKICMAYLDDTEIVQKKLKDLKK